MVTKKFAGRKRVAKKPAKVKKKPAKNAPVASEAATTNRAKLVNAGVINPTYSFSSQDSEAIETLSNQEVNVLINVYGKLGEEFFETNSPNGFVF